MGRYGKRGTCLRGRPWLTIRVSATARTPYLKQWCCVTSHHEWDLLAGLRLPADQQNTAAENQKGHRKRGQGPNLHVQDGVDVVGGDVAEHAHHCNCVHHKQSLIQCGCGATWSHCELLTQHTDGYVDQAWRVLRGRGGGPQSDLQRWAATFQHVEVRLGLCEVRLSNPRGQEDLLTKHWLSRCDSFWLVPAT